MAPAILRGISMKALLIATALLVSATSAHAADRVIWACNLSDGTSLTFVKDSKKASGKLTRFNDAISENATADELLILEGADVIESLQVSYKLDGSLAKFSSGLKIDLSSEYQLAEGSESSGKVVVYPWTATLGESQGGCFGVELK